MKMRSKKILLGVVAPLCVGIILVAILFQVGNFAQAHSALGTPTPIDPVLASLNRQINDYDNQLKNKDLSAEMQKGIQAKKKYLEKQATQRAEYLVNQDLALQSKLTAIAGETVSPTLKQNNEIKPTPFEGPLEEFYAPKYREADFSTAWIVPTEKSSILYLAGSLVKDPAQGVIYIENRDVGTTRKYLTPYKDGSLKILRVDKNRAYLESKNGRAYFFSLTKNTFVDELDVPLPEATSTPKQAYP